MTSSWIVRCYLWACQRLYDEFAWSYDVVSWLVSGGRWAQWRRAALDYLWAAGDADRPANDCRVLEVGFGTGELLTDMARRGLNAHGLELSHAMQQITRRKVAHRGLTIPRVQAVGQATPYADATFDVIVTTFPAAYIFEMTTLRECVRLLRPDGRLVIVGAWVRLAQPQLARLPLLFFGQPADAAIEQIRARMADTGLKARFTEYPDGVARVSVIVGEKYNSKSAG